MYQLRVASVRDGLHPSEVIVTLDTDQGQVNLAIDRASLTDNLIVVGYPVAKRDGQVLVELPRETTTDYGAYGSKRPQLGWLSRDLHRSGNPDSTR